MANVSELTAISYSGDIRVDALLKPGVFWNYILPARNTLYYTFDLSAIGSRSDGPASAFNASQKAAAATALTYAGTVTGINFVEVASGASADFHFAATNVSGANTTGFSLTTYGYQYNGSGTITAFSAEAFIFLDNVEFAAMNVAPSVGTAGYELLLHEIGHALDLGHPFEGPYTLPAAQDSSDYTVMSYTHAGLVKPAYQSYDLLALKWIYGGDGLGGRFGYNSALGPSLTLVAPVDDFAASVATTGLLSADGGAIGEINAAGDRDWFAISLQAGARYVFELKGSPSGDGTLANPMLNLRSGGGASLASNDDFGSSLNARISYSAAATGVLYLEASSSLASGTGTYRITAVRDASNRAPIAVADLFGIYEDTDASGNVLANDNDPDGQSLSAVLLTNPAHGAVTLSVNGQFTYKPLANYNGNDFFTYRASDGSANATATVSLNILPVNDPPVAANASVNTDEDTALKGILPVAFDVDGDSITYALQTVPSHGGVAVTTAGLFTYIPAGDFSGIDVFGFRVADMNGGANAYMVTVIVRPVVDDLQGTAGDDDLSDLSGDARLFGLAGDDRLRGGSGNDAINGGSGIDTAVFGAGAANFLVARVGSTFVVTDKTGAEGVDTLSETEKLQFNGKVFDLINPAPDKVPAYGQQRGFLFDAVYYLLDNPDLVPTITLAGAAQQYFSTGAAQGRAPNAWFDATNYENRYADLRVLNLDDASLFAHYNLYGVWEGRAGGPRFDQFDGSRYLRDNPDVAVYVDARIGDFLGSRSSGAIAHFLIYGGNEGRGAFDVAGQSIRLDYTVDLAL